MPITKFIEKIDRRREIFIVLCFGMSSLFLLLSLTVTVVFNHEVCFYIKFIVDICLKINWFYNVVPPLWVKPIPHVLPPNFEVGYTTYMSSFAYA